MAKYTIVIVDHETQKAQTLTGDQIAAIAYAPTDAEGDCSSDAVIDCRAENFCDWLCTSDFGQEIRRMIIAETAAFYSALMRGAEAAEREASEPHEA